MLIPERLKEIYKSPKSTLLGALAGAAGVLLVVIQGADGGLESLNTTELASTGVLLAGMILGFFKKDKKD